MFSLLSKIEFIFVTAILSFPIYGQSGTCAGMSTGPGASLNGFIPFPANSPWNTDISNAAVDPNSDQYINYIGATAALHADFGAGQWAGHSIGMPYQIEPAAVPGRAVQKIAYPTESDPGPVPLPAFTIVQGYPNPNGTDRHVIVLDQGNCWLYELYNAKRSGTQWTADDVAIWDMTAAGQRPYSWTSANAAGLPIFPGLVRYDEVAAGEIRHAVIFTATGTQEAFTPPASHLTYGVTDPNAPPMGMRVRLKASFDISSYPTDIQVILTALQHYGMILSDNGSPMFISGTSDSRWNNNDLAMLGNITAASFEVVSMGEIYTPATIPTGPSPTIANFQSNAAQVAAGTPVTLSWTTANDGYDIITPGVGPVRGTSVVVQPGATTTYTLNATNQYGRSTASVTVTVQ